MDLALSTPSASTLSSTYSSTVSLQSLAASKPNKPRPIVAKKPAHLTISQRQLSDSGSGAAVAVPGAARNVTTAVPNPQKPLKSSSAVQTSTHALSTSPTKPPPAALARPLNPSITYPSPPALPPPLPKQQKQQQYQVQPDEEDSVDEVTTVVSVTINPTTNRPVSGPAPSQQTLAPKFETLSIKLELNRRHQ